MFAYNFLILPCLLRNQEAEPGETGCHCPARPFCYVRRAGTWRTFPSNNPDLLVFFHPTSFWSQNFSCTRFLFQRLLFPIQNLPEYRLETLCRRQSLIPSIVQPCDLQSPPSTDKNVQSPSLQRRQPRNTRKGRRGFLISAQKLLFDCRHHKDADVYTRTSCPMLQSSHRKCLHLITYLQEGHSGRYRLSIDSSS
jgi:hypothetical protein